MKITYNGDASAPYDPNGPLALPVSPEEHREKAVNDLIAYIEQENAVLHARVRQLEISLASEREACAKVAEEYWRRPSYEAFTDPQRVTSHIATLIRGREK